MNRKVTAFAALAVVPLTLALFSLDVWVGFVNLHASGKTFALSDLTIVVATLILPLSFSSMGALLLWFRPRNKVGWLMPLVGIFFMVAVLSADYAHLALDSARGSHLPFGLLAAWVGDNVWIPYFFILVNIVMLFPTGVPLGKRWRSLVFIAPPIFLVGAAIHGLKPGVFQNSPGKNPIGTTAVTTGIGAVADVALTIGALVIAAFAIAALFRRFYLSRGQERQQLKWFSYGAIMAGLTNTATIIVGWSGAIAFIALGALASLPICMAIAILRYRLYDIDVLINRTLVYVLLTLSIGAIYISGVVFLQFLLRTFTGQGSNLAIALSTLAIAALFQPLRRRIQHLVDSRFYRRKYDGALILQSFTSSLRDEVDLSHLSSDLVSAVREALQPATVSLWLRESHS